MPNMAWGCVGKKMDDIEKHLWAQEKLCLAAAKDYPEGIHLILSGLLLRSCT